MARVLVVEDKASLREMLRKTLAQAGHAVETASDGHEAKTTLGKSRFDVVLTDLRLPRMDGHKLLLYTRELDPTPEVILLTAYGSIERAVEAMRHGAHDFLEKPVDPDHLLLLIDRALEKRRLIYENTLLREESRQRLPTIIGEHPSLQAVMEKIQKVAQTDATVLLRGESGTGKELFARTIHQLSPRHENSFVAMNCAAIPENLLENELFGHEEGAYTGARGQRVGRFEVGDGGTIFLDEISELQLSLQAKILRVIEQRSFERVGGVDTIEVDVRLIAATNANLEVLVEEKKFRDDLYYRLNVVPISIPPLRERRSDIPTLTQFFISTFAREFHKPEPEPTPEALELLQSYPWPGNVRELENRVERAMILCDGPLLSPSHLSLDPSGHPSPGPEQYFDLDGDLQEVLRQVQREVERHKIGRALDESGGDRKKAAKILNIHYKTLLKKIKALALSNSPPEKSSNESSRPAHSTTKGEQP